MRIHGAGDDDLRRRTLPRITPITRSAFLGFFCFFSFSSEEKKTSLFFCQAFFLEEKKSGKGFRGYPRAQPHRRLSVQLSCNIYPIRIICICSLQYEKHQGYNLIFSPFCMSSCMKSPMASKGRSVKNAPLRLILVVYTPSTSSTARKTSRQGEVSPHPSTKIEGLCIFHPSDLLIATTSFFSCRSRYRGFSEGLK